LSHDHHEPAAAAAGKSKAERARGTLRVVASIVLLVAYTAAALIFLIPSRSLDLPAADSLGLATQRLPVIQPGAIDTARPDSGLVRPAAAALAAPAPVVDSAALEHDAISRFAHGPLAKVLRRRARRESMADSIASALVHEATRLKVAPSLLAAVLVTENPELDTSVVSSQGATGLMQVMPFHAGEYGCKSTNLIGIRTNICHGARVFGYYLKRTKDLRTALLRYNGCVRSTNTPRCHTYPDKVMRLASKMRRQLLQNASKGGTAAAAAAAEAAAPLPTLDTVAVDAATASDGT
jgi:hypothetical protein